MADVLLDGVSLQDAILSTDIGLDVIGANRDLAGIDVSLAGVADAPFYLSRRWQMPRWQASLSMIIS